MLVPPCVPVLPLPSCRVAVPLEVLLGVIHVARGPSVLGALVGDVGGPLVPLVLLWLVAVSWCAFL